MAGKIDAGVQKCIGALQGAKNDTEKMAALFLVTKTVKAAKLNKESRLALFEAIGFKFLLRLLKSPSSPDCPAVLYKSVSLSILTTFCAEPSIAQSPEMLEAVPIFLEIIEKAGDGDDDDDQILMVVSEAYHCLKCLASVKKGRQALAKAGAVKRLCELYRKEGFSSEESLEVIKGMAVGLGSTMWGGNPELFNELMDRVSLQFEADDSEQKFELAGLMASVMMSYNMSKEAVESSFWPHSVHKGLVDILSSKITDKQRDPAIKLASVMLTTLGVEWMIRCAEQGSEQAYQFLTLLVHLSCIEVRMVLEDRSFDRIMSKDDIIGACYGIIETTMKFMRGNHYENLDAKQKEQIFHSLKGSSQAILGFINKVRSEAEKNPKKFWDDKKKLLAVASVKCLAGYLAEDSSTLKEELFKQLPFILALVFETFQDYEDDLSAEAQVLAEQGKSIEPFFPEVLCGLLPSLCHLTAEIRGVRALLDSESEEMLNKFLNSNWTVYKNLKDWHEKKSRPGKPGKKPVKKEGEPDMSVEEMKTTLTKLRTAIEHTCNLFINMSLLDPQAAGQNPIFQQVMRWAFTALPTLESGEELSLLANVSSLGLTLLLNVLRKTSDPATKDSLSPEDQFAAQRIISGADNAVFRFGQSVIRFIWDAHLPDETQSPVVLGIAYNYREVWSDIREMWFLSLQTLGPVMEYCPWLADFGAESGFLEALIKNLSLVYKSLIDMQTLDAYEEFFCCAARSAPSAANVMKTKGAALASSHHLRKLTKVLKGDEAKK